jgi:hypothetical protein
MLDCLPLSRLVVLAATALLLVGIACSDSSAGDANDKCCPLDEPPTSCNSLRLGGSRAQNPSCGAANDNLPPMRRTTDADGCLVYVPAAGASDAVPYANDCPKRDAAAD